MDLCVWVGDIRQQMNVSSSKMNLEATKDLSEFDKDQIMARSISKTGKSGPSKEQW